MSKFFSLTCELYPVLILRTIRNSDQSNLRNWKNENRGRFFFQDIITESTQQQWFKGYLARDHDYIFIVEVASCEIGCMGIRLVEETWDIYNVILGDQKFAKKGYMSQALHMMCKYAISLRQACISTKVLKDNPALSWYCRNAFRVVSIHSDYVEMKLDTSCLDRCLINLLL